MQGVIASVLLSNTTSILLYTCTDRNYSLLKDITLGLWKGNMTQISDSRTWHETYNPQDQYKVHNDPLLTQYISHPFHTKRSTNIQYMSHKINKREEQTRIKQLWLWSIYSSCVTQSILMSQGSSMCVFWTITVTKNCGRTTLLYNKLLTTVLICGKVKKSVTLHYPLQYLCVLIFGHM
jgi:hypothetical protein